MVPARFVKNRYHVDEGPLQFDKDRLAGKLSYYVAICSDSVVGIGYDQVGGTTYVLLIIAR